MNNLVLVEDKNIQSKIYTIRGLQVMLDRDLAELYGVKAIRLREQVRRNTARFPQDFMFELTDYEVDFMVSQNAIPSRKHLGGSMPLVFTEQGVATISAVLTSEKATRIHIDIMRAFVNMRRFLQNNASIFQRLETLEVRQIQQKLEIDEKFSKIFKAIDDKELKPKQHIFYDGQIFDAYVFVSDIIKSAKSSIELIDNYIDESVLVLFSKRDKSVKVTFYTKDITRQLKQDVEKHNAQYPKIELKEFKLSHDRFLIVDKKEIYHLGASLKDLGKKWFAVTKMDVSSLEMLDKLNTSKTPNFRALEKI